MVRLPFEENRLDDSSSVRIFKADVDPEELKWHRDQEDRIVESLNETDWMIQMDNELPKPIKGMIRIPRGVWHRVIRGSGDLEVRIDKI